MYRSPRSFGSDLLGLTVCKGPRSRLKKEVLDHE